MDTAHKKYARDNLVCFSLDISQKKKTINGVDVWKKSLWMPKEWEKHTLDTSVYDDTKNALALITGEKNMLIVVDIDNVDHWRTLLEDTKQREPKTVKAISGSGGIHYYFKYNEKLAHIKTSTHCFGAEYDIDIRTNKGCIIAPPSTYYDNNTQSQVTYKWKRSIFKHDVLEFPEWMLDKINSCSDARIKPKNTKPIADKKAGDQLDDPEIIADIENLDDDPDTAVPYNFVELKQLLAMLSPERLTQYDKWLAVGIAIHNITHGNGFVLWDTWSSGGSSYDQKACKYKWSTFKKTPKPLTIKSLLYWCKQDALDLYEQFKADKQGTKIIIKKFPDVMLDMGMVSSHEHRKCICLNNPKCVFIGDEHYDMEKSMYIDINRNTMDIKCRHLSCISKTYPCPSIQLDRNESKLINYGTINVTINNNFCDGDLLEFQRLDIFGSDEMNEIVYKSLTNEDSAMASIIYHYYKDQYAYGDDENWYVFRNHRWRLMGDKNTRLMADGRQKIKDIYTTLIEQYTDANCDAVKIRELCKIKKIIGDANKMREVMSEVKAMFSNKNNADESFVKKLDANNNLIGFNNGVFDLKTYEFRDGKPDDMITMSTGYNYTPQYTEKYPDLMRFIEDIQPQKEEREYLLTYLSHSLFGNTLELFTILTGGGRNGKSKLIDLIKKTFGDYFGSVKSQMFTRPQPDAQQPDPGLLGLCYKRIIVSGEPEKQQKLNSGFIKFITGRDSVALRECHQNKMIDFQAKFVTLFVCNDIPETDEMDTAFSDSSPD